MAEAASAAERAADSQTVWRAVVPDRGDNRANQTIFSPERRGHVVPGPLPEVRGRRYFQLRDAGASRTINCLDERPIAERSRALALTCANCGNDRNFQVKTVQMHVVHLEDERVEVSDEGRPAVLEVLCDECENPINFEEFEDALRREVMLTIGAR
jgi:5-methylcytosine-specific restriction endonuclease McrA